MTLGSPSFTENILGGLGVVNTLDLNQAGARVGGVTRALVAHVTSPKPSLSVQILRFDFVPCVAKFDIGSIWEIAAGASPKFSNRMPGAQRMYSLDVYYSMCVSKNHQPIPNSSIPSRFGSHRVGDKGTHVCDRLPKAS